ncbi:MAG: DUF1501 domain-containing protein [Fuerstiella sp.]|nr:DUF1501 domain-containing protein [Fuerstiella sp.]
MKNGQPQRFGDPIDMTTPHVSQSRRYQFVSRRNMLRDVACGFGHVALLGLLSDSARAGTNGTVNPLVPKVPPLVQRAKRVIFLFMHGGVSQVDTFDPKPVLAARDGEPLPQSWRPPGLPLGQNVGRQKELRLMRSPWRFHRHGQSGIEVSTLFPHIAGCIDDLCVVRSLSHDFVTHAPAGQVIHTGSGVFKWPSFGAWIQYGLGTENHNLPGFVTICPPSSDAGTNFYGSAFLPAAYQGTALGRTTGAGQMDDGALAQFSNLRPARLESAVQRMELDWFQSQNRQHLDRAGYNPQLEARIQSFELAFRMQATAPEVVDMAGETKETLSLYGIDQNPTDNFGRMCLMARRFSERGVRFVQASHSYKWDQHGGLKAGHERNALEVDIPVAGLLKDLKRRGLLDDTLVLWASEFGRTPVAESRDGRDHNPYGYTIWMAGGGVKGGMTYGATDEIGFFAVENKVTIHDLHATILYQLGLDHEQLAYYYGGRDFRPTDVDGEVVHGLLA